jgi:hypothetical protein
MITDTQSYSWVIRDMLHDKLAAAPFFSGFTIRKSRALQLQPQHIPYLGTYIIGEDMAPDGDFSAGHIRFISTLRVGFSVVVQNNDPPACEAKLDQAFAAICNTLWRDPYLMNMVDTTPYVAGGSGVGNPDNTRIEGIGRGSRRFVYGSSALDNEMPIGELQYEAAVVHRFGFEPVITDDLLEIAVRTGVKHGDTQEEMDKRHQTGGLHILTPAD